MKLFAQLYGSTFEADKSTVGWEHFRKAMDLRNRITHPKNAESFQINDTELKQVEFAREWFANTIEKLLEEC